MIKSADEFIRLRQSEDLNEQHRAGHEEADINIWYEIIQRYPEYKTWIIHNKTIPLEILELLAKDRDPKIRGDVARKRKINDTIFHLLSMDDDENVRYGLMCNTKLTIEKKKSIKVDDSTWLKKKFEEIKNKET